MWQKLKNYLVDVKFEIKKLVIPDKKSLWGSTFVVILVSIALSVLIGLFDFIISKGLIMITR
ncbi:MAG: preprotein translocase subunit SecE [bacterium]